MKILITGGSGLLGQYLNLFLSKEHEILTIYNSKSGNCILFNSIKIDLKNEIELKKIFYQFRPQVVIHSAAITSAMLDNKYSLSEYYQSNVIVTENIAKLSSSLNSRLIYLSTDLVYDGNRGSYLIENSKLNPISPYAESKLIGEEKVKEFSDNYVILRLALLVGFGLYHSVCHFQSMYNNFKENKPVKLFTDQFRTPISLLEVSNSIKKIIETDIPSDIYNLGGNERVSRFELGLMLSEILKTDKNLLVPTELKEAHDVPKVIDVSLNNNKLKSCGIKINSLEEMILDSLAFKKQNSFL